MEKKFLLNENSRILTLNEVSGKKALKIFDMIGLESTYTDFAYCLGGKLTRESEREFLASYHVKSPKGETRAYVEGDYIIYTNEPDTLSQGVRVVTNLPGDLEDSITYDDNGIPYVYYGEYPQTVATRKEENMINLFTNLTGDRYVVSNHCNIPKRVERDEDLMETIPEMDLDGQKYAGLKIKSLGYNESILLSNGREAYNNSIRRFRVEPIKWYVDEETGLLVSDKILSAGVPVSYLSKHTNNVKRLTKKNKKN